MKRLYQQVLIQYLWRFIVLTVGLVLIGLGVMITGDLKVLLQGTLANAGLYFVDHVKLLIGPVSPLGAAIAGVLTVTDRHNAGITLCLQGSGLNPLPYPFVAITLSALIGLLLCGGGLSPLAPMAPSDSTIYLRHGEHILVAQDLDEAEAALKQVLLLTLDKRGEMTRTLSAPKAIWKGDHWVAQRVSLGEQNPILARLKLPATLPSPGILKALKQKEDLSLLDTWSQDIRPQQRKRNARWSQILVLPAMTAAGWMLASFYSSLWIALFGATALGLVQLWAISLWWMNLSISPWVLLAACLTQLGFIFLLLQSVVLGRSSSRVG